MELLNRSFTVSSTAMAAGVPMESIKNWTKQGVMIGHPVAGGGTPGKYRRYSFFNVMEIAVAGAILDMGFKSVPHAFRIAVRFAHAGTDIQLPSLPAHQSRGTTYLYFSGERAFVEVVDRTPLAESVIRHRLSDPAGYAVLNISQIFASVCQRMALHPYEVLDEAYPKDAED